jgi:hypothetical protein
MKIVSLGLIAALAAAAPISSASAHFHLFGGGHGGGLFSGHHGGFGRGDGFSHGGGFFRGHGGRGFGLFSAPAAVVAGAAAIATAPIVSLANAGSDDREDYGAYNQPPPYYGEQRDAYAPQYGYPPQPAYAPAPQGYYPQQQYAPQPQYAPPQYAQPPQYAPQPYGPPQYGPPQAQYAPQQYAQPQYGPPPQYAPQQQYAPPAYYQQQPPGQ